MQGGLKQKVEIFEGILWVIITCILHQGVLVPLRVPFPSPSVFFILYNIFLYMYLGGACYSSC